MIRFLLISSFFLFLCAPLFSQKTSSTSASERFAAKQQRDLLKKNSLVKELKFRSVGPSVFGGRVADLEVNPKDPNHFYVAYASGGLWETKNNGLSYEPLFENEAVITIGDIAVNWENKTIWIGSGENNSSRSSYAGLGMYRSIDGGQSWQHRGLAESHHIGRIVLHPENPDILWVAVLGHLYSPNKERGIYKSTDGGRTWKLNLYVDENSGGIDLLVDKENPDVLYAATWNRSRRAWNFEESGPGSGIWKSTDGGDNWNRLNTPTSGFPVGKGVGRIGLSQYKKESKDILYAVVDNYERRPKEAKEQGEGLTKDAIKSMSKESFLALDRKVIAGFLKSNNFPEKYSVDVVLEKIENNSIKPLALVEYLEDANSLLFDTPVKGAEVYRSENGGKTWSKTHSDYLDDIFYSYGYYFGQIRVDANDSEAIYFMGVPIVKSKDGGKSFESIQGANVHVDHHALWINPNKPGHLICGNDGGVTISYDDGATWMRTNSPAVGQFYSVNTDASQPYKIYGGTQDNGVWSGPSTYKKGDQWQMNGRYPYESIMGGDGMQVEIDTRDNKTIYTGYQFGNYYRLNEDQGEYEYLELSHDLGERPLRFNWQTPIHLSKHNQDILYMGSNKFHRSLNQGDSFETLSGDLTQGGIKGDVPYGTLSSIHESPLRMGLIYTGSDDGLIHVSKDGGYTWEKINKGFPKDKWVTKVQASAHKIERVYMALNGYRSDDFNAYVYVSENQGKTWKAIGKNLPNESVNVIKEDPVNQNILYVGTDHGLYISLDRGLNFMLADNGLPAVPVHDLVIQSGSKDLVIGTHGRSIYVANIGPLQQMNANLLAKIIHVFETGNQAYSPRWGSNWSKWLEPRTPSLKIPFYTKSAGPTSLEIYYGDQVVRSIELDAKKGLNYYNYDLSIDPSYLDPYTKLLNEGEEAELTVAVAKNGLFYLKPGGYSIVLKQNASEASTGFKITTR